jgi:ferredoxin-NADP reductase
MVLSETSAPGFAGVVGRLGKTELETLLEGVDRAETVAMMCGPGPMVAAVADVLEDLGLRREAIVYERFDYAGGHASRQDRRRRARFLAVGAGLALGVVAFAALG